MFYLTVAPQKYNAETESIMITNRAGQLGRILQFIMSRITTENSVFRTS